MMRRKKAVMVSSIWISDVPLRIALKFRFISGLWAIAVPGAKGRAGMRLSEVAWDRP